jgi:ADP-ribosylglycohydrolase
MMALDSSKLAGLILGTAVGDSLGLPREGLSRLRARRLFGGPPFRHQLLFGRGMISDDTEHTCLVGQALLRASGDPEAFGRALAWRLRLWLLGFPAGMGLSTLRAVLKLWLGYSHRRSGVFSAGNGPAMRAALLGACLGDDPVRLRAFVRISTRITHTDPRAERGALLVALAAHEGASRSPAALKAGTVIALRKLLDNCDDELGKMLDTIQAHLEQNVPPAMFAKALGLSSGVSGYIYDTVPVALYCWLHSPGDFQRAVEDVIDLGGDTDSTGAIVGALAGATVGLSGIPAEWISGILEWPLSVAWMRNLADRLVRCKAGPMSLFWPGLIPRNLIFLAVVLTHGFRRLLPPY